MQMCSQKIEIEKNTSMEGERSVQIVLGVRRSGEIDQQNVIMHKTYLNEVKILFTNFFDDFVKYLLLHNERPRVSKFPVIFAFYKQSESRAKQNKTQTNPILTQRKY